MAPVTPTLASVFRRRSAPASWSKLEVDDELSQFCSQIWGKIIEDEEAKQWRKSHSTVKVDDANDIGPECYVLDLGIELKCSELWVRQDYIRIYDFCSKRHEEGPSSATERARSVVITGHTGIGKTYWVTYAARRRLGEQKPFLWYQDGVCFLFVKDGVFQQDVERVSAGDFAPFLWAFIDADARPTGVLERLVGNTNLYIMFTTSPKRQRWKTLSNCTKCAVIIMNPWSLEEIHLVAEIHGLTNEQQNFAKAYFKELGPIPGVCIDFVKDPSLIVDYKSCRQAMVTDLTSHSLRHFVLTGGNLNLDAESHTIFIVRRIEVDDLERAYIEPISANVEIQLMMAFNELQWLERIDLYHRFASVTATRAVAGLAYESLGHTLLQEGITLALKPMRRSLKRKIFHWQSQGEEHASNSMDQDGSVVLFPPNIAIIYEQAGLTSGEPNRLHVPKARNQVAFDYFLKLGAFLYIMQFIMANDHDIKKRMEESFAGLMNVLPPKMNWRFVFITPPDCEVDVKATSEVKQSLEGVTLYSAHLEIKQRMRLIALPEVLRTPQRMCRARVSRDEQF